jgi:hypothetical protein
MQVPLGLLSEPTPNDCKYKKNCLQHMEAGLTYLQSRAVIGSSSPGDAFYSYVL